MIGALVLSLAVPLAAAGPAAAPESPASSQIVVSLQPAAGEACASVPGPPDPPRCAPCLGGACRIEVPPSWTGVDLNVEAKSPDHFAETRVGRAGEAMAFRLTPHPSLDWKGWTGSAAPADVEWLPADRSDEWRPLRKGVTAGRIVLPQESRGVRLSPAGRGSPKTLFAPGLRSSFGPVGPLPVQPGGEVAVCLEVRERRRAPPPTPLKVADSAGKEHALQTSAGGCAALSGLQAGPVTVSPDGTAKFRFDPVHGRVRAGESLWFGTLSVSGPASLTVSVDDPETTRVYTVRVETANPVEPQPVQVGARIAAGSRQSWELPASEYLISLHPEASDSSDLEETIRLAGSEERTFTFSPRYLRVEGTAMRGSAPLAGSPLLFSREDASGREMTLRRTTTPEGGFTGWFGQAGTWQVRTGGESRMGSMSRPVRFLVPDAPASTVDIRFPAGVVAGIVVNAKTGKPMGPVPLVVTVRESDGDREFTTSLTSDSDGKFRLDSLPDSHVSVGVRDAIASLMRVRSGARAIVDVHEDGEQTAELRLEPIDDGGRLLIVDRSGAPVAGAQAHRADLGLMGAILGPSDDQGVISLTKDIPPGAPMYVIAAAHPWAKTAAPRDDEPPRSVMLDDPRRDPAIVRFEAADGVPPAELFFGLTDSAGAEVPLFFHLIRQGALPTAHGGTAVIPQAGDGAYTLWVKGAKSAHSLGAVVFPSQGPLVLSLVPCGADCAGP